MTSYERLKQARQARFQTAADAADALGIPRPTYIHYESGRVGFSRHADRLARFFGVPLDWLLTGRGSLGRDRTAGTVPLVGFVGAGAAATLYGQGDGIPDEDVPAPPNASDRTVAVEVRGTSLGDLFDRWLVFYDDVRDPVSEDILGKLCACGLADGRILVKKIMRGQLPGHFHLFSNTEPPMYDVLVDWAARVKTMMPRT